MKAIKKWLNRFFIDGLSGMALGLFSTLIIGTILTQIGGLVSSYLSADVGYYITIIGKVASSLTGAGIGAGVAAKFKVSPAVTISAMTAGMIGAFATKLIAGSVLVNGVITYSGPGEPLGA
ncbi:MAG: PTS sugar transporter subunit IIC, partial [Clostridia bacterium]|nr:PTS sugar transporter subunit IIC [Clostridia bacterium]